MHRIALQRVNEPNARFSRHFDPIKGKWCKALNCRGHLNVRAKTFHASPDSSDGKDLPTT